ncbi:MAG: L,D-transpeptidase family protein [Candidatus Binataceae bacterium]
MRDSLKYRTHNQFRWLAAALCLAVAAWSAPRMAHGWTDSEFDKRPLYAYPLPHGRDNIIGNLITYQIQKGDTLLDVGRWFGVTATEISSANGKIDWWTPPVGRNIILPDEHILPDTPHVGIILNIPEMRIYYYFPSPTGPVLGGKRKLKKAAFKTGGVARREAHSGIHPDVVYTFPVGLGRFDWKTPLGAFTVRGKTKEPTWVVPQDIYEEHLERDGEAEHMIPGGDPDNPLGHYRLELTLPEYALHGTNVPWGVGMEVSHGCVRLYPEDIERLFNKVRVGTPGEFVYQPIKFGWRGDSLYVEVHDDLYGVYPGLWAHAQDEIKRLGIEDQVDLQKLEKAVESKTGIPTYVMPGDPPAGTAG